MSMVEIKGLGREKDESYPRHEMDYQVDASPKLKLEIISSDEECEKIIDAIKRHAHPGGRGDGKVVVYEIRELHSIRTGKKVRRYLILEPVGLSAIKNKPVIPPMARPDAKPEKAPKPNISIGALLLLAVLATI